MSKIYQYRKHINWGQYFFAVLFALLIVAMVIGGVMLFLLSPSQDHLLPSPEISLLAMIVFVSFIFAIEVFIGWYVFYRLAGVRVIIKDDSVIYRHRGGETKIGFAEITKIGFPSIPYCGGWMTVCAGEERIRLTVAVGEIADFVQTFKASLDKCGLSDRYDESKLYNFLKTATFCDHNMERTDSYFWRVVIAAFCMCGLGVATAMISKNAGLVWVYLSYTFPILLVVIAEVVLAIRIARTSIRGDFYVPPRDIAYEKMVYRIVSMIGFAIYAVLSIIIIFAP